MCNSPIAFSELNYYFDISCREHRGLKPLIKLINTNGPDLLTNVSLALGRCAEDGEALKYIRHLDGIKYKVPMDQMIFVIL